MTPRTDLTAVFRRQLAGRPDGEGHAGFRGSSGWLVASGVADVVAPFVTHLPADDGDLARFAGLDAPARRVPYPLARTGGALAELAWAAAGRSDDPPMTRFLAEQLATAHWFDQRRTHEVLRWRPAVDFDEGFRRLAASYSGRP